MSQPIDTSSQQQPLPEDFQNANAIIDSISTPKDSQPTKLRVKNFKNRVFQLVKIYTAQTPNVNPLIQCLKQQMFLRQPEKMKQLVNDILNKPNVTLENLQQLLEYYKIILLYKLEKSHGDNVSANFVKVLKKIASLDKNLVNETVLGMLKSFAFQRKCHLSINFFLFLFRKYDHGVELKKLVIEKCHQLIGDEKLRNAQKKQVGKLLSTLDKSTKIKVKTQVNEVNDNAIEEEQSDDIKAIPKKKPSKMKIQKKQDKIEEQGDAQDKPKKEMSVQQQQKLKRIKENKKKNRKQNNQSQKKTQPKNNQQKKQQKNAQRKNNHQKVEKSTQQKEQKSKPQKQQKVNPQKEEKNINPQRERKSTPQREEKVNPQREQRVNHPREERSRNPREETSRKPREERSRNPREERKPHQREERVNNHSGERRNNHHSGQRKFNNPRQQRSNNHSGERKFNNPREERRAPFNGSRGRPDSRDNKSNSRPKFNNNKKFQNKR